MDVNNFSMGNNVSDYIQIVVAMIDGWNMTRPTTDDNFRPLISDSAMWYLNIYVNTVLCGTVSIFGTGNNFINIVIFSRLGLKDSMSVCLFCLAVTDFMLSFVVTCSRVFPVWNVFFSTEYINPSAIWFAAFDWLADSFFHCSGWITTFLAIERCVCVTFPFKVKQIFTRNRAVGMVLLIYAGNAFIYIPIYTTHFLSWVDIEIVTENGTRKVKQKLTLTYSDNREEIEYYHQVINGHILPMLSLFLILCSVMWMTHGLYRSSNIRRTLTQTTLTSAEGGMGSGLNKKSTRLVKVVLILAVIFFLCNLPRTFSMLMHLINSDIRHSGKEYNMFDFQWHFTSLATVVNASVNIFVYLTINSNYRAKFKELCCCKTKD